MRKFAKLDANHRAIASALEGIGCSVISLAPLGNGAPDLLVGFRGRTICLEVKDGSKPPSARRLTPLEKAFFARWRGGDLFVVDSIEDAIERVKGRPLDENDKLLMLPVNPFADWRRPSW
jgi:hypothetical protein